MSPWEPSLRPSWEAGCRGGNSCPPPAEDHLVVGGQGIVRIHLNRLSRIRIPFAKCQKVRNLFYQASAYLCLEGWAISGDHQQKHRQGQEGSGLLLRRRQTGGGGGLWIHEEAHCKLGMTAQRDPVLLGVGSGPGQDCRFFQLSSRNSEGGLWGVCFIRACENPGRGWRGLYP